MLKQIICALFTIKNILVLSSLLLGYASSECTQPTPPTLTVADFATQLPEVLKFTRDNAGSGCTIHVVPETTWFSSLSGSLVAKWRGFSESFTLKNVGLSIVSGALSLGVVSYLLCAYVIYKVYRLAQTATSWINWCSDDELLLDDETLYEKLALHRSRRRHLQRKNLLTLHQEKKLLSEYLTLDALLQTHGLRHYFPYTTLITKNDVQRAWQRLEKAHLLGIR